MPGIPPTRRKLLKNPDQDHIQWTLTNRNRKTVYGRPPKAFPIKALTTLDIAKKFLDLVNSSNSVSV